MVKSSVLIVHTGGTIGMVQNEKTKALTPIHFDNLFETVPTLKKIDVHLEIVAFEHLIDSSNVNIDFWVHIAEVIEKNYNKFDGFVILHGTDTMSYSASMLSFMLENLNKPVIFTGSQLPLGIVRTDGRENFINAIELAAAKNPDESPVVPEVAIYFENQLLRGNRSYKHSAENFNAFLSGNYPPLANVGVHIRYNEDYIIKKSNKNLIVHKQLCSNVAILKIFPNINTNVVESILNIKNLRGLVLETYGSGNAMTEDWFIKLLKVAIDKDIVILNVTQCKLGSVAMGKYETSVKLAQIGVISGFDITTESAIAKMMFLFGQDYPVDTVKKLLQTSLRGEMTIE